MQKKSKQATFRAILAAAHDIADIARAKGFAVASEKRPPGPRYIVRSVKERRIELNTNCCTCQANLELWARGPHIGVYCAHCRKWLAWMPKAVLSNLGIDPARLSQIQP